MSSKLEAVPFGCALTVTYPMMTAHLVVLKPLETKKKRYGTEYKKQRSREEEMERHKIQKGELGFYD